ncbi:MAG: TonB-dependent receptor [Bacteroidota bacterium]|nr:TonB-dependent receptor [Bacteroidota bacterium]MDP4194977.1 TonB-dependent receptor [Bacteroidota bacterium]
MLNFGAIVKTLACLLILLISISNPILSAEMGKIRGKVTDSNTGEALPGATVIIKGTSVGAATDFEGKYLISQAPQGKQTVQISYVGYKSKEIHVNVFPGKTTELNVQLIYSSVDMKEVVVTAQLEGQSAAINQQLSSNTIVNVVSKDRIQELPDQNAAETLGRLPGIALQRNNGEGQKVVVRGLSPRFSSITVNGVQLPSTSQPGGFSNDGSGDADDRSVDLSMISPDILEGIEVFKAQRPDMDGDAIGGTVNFTTKKAVEGSRSSFRMFGGYNNLENDYGNYRGSFSYSNRFFKNEEEGYSKLGIVLGGSIQKANRASDGAGGTYSWTGQTNGEPVYQTSNVSLTKHNEIRRRYGLNLAMDYSIAENNDIFLTSLWAGTHQDEKDRTHNYAISGGYHDRTYFEREVDLNTWSNSLTGKHLLSNFEVNWTVSYSISKSKSPWGGYANFSETSGFSNNMPIENLDPSAVSNYALNDYKAAFLGSAYIQNEDLKDHNTTAEINIQHPFFFGSDISGYIKLGGKLRDKSREKNVDQYGGLRWYTGQKIMTAYPGVFIPAANSSADISLSNFISNQSSLDNFLGGDYKYNEVMDEGALHNFLDKYQPIFKQTKNYKMDVEDYNASENIYSGYLMTEIKWQQVVTFMPGFRYENTSTDYSTKVANPATSTLMMKKALSDSLGSRSYGNFLPMAQLRIKPVDWMDIRLAVTKSLSRPNFLSLIPYEVLDYDNLTLRYGNPNLKETKATNYDAYLSIYNSKWGLFTVGKFYKRLNDIDYQRSKIMAGGYYSPYLTNLKGWTVTTPENLPDVTTVDGWELELQTNFVFLPSPFDGILLYANFSFIHSETQYPYTNYETVYLDHAPWVTTISTEMKRTGRMIGQPDRIGNVTIGYEKAGFSGRLSVIYQGDALRGVGMSEANDELDDSSIRLDLVLQQKIGNNLSFIVQLNNITNREEKTFIRYRDLTTRTQDYGMTLDCGFQLKF